MADKTAQAKIDELTPVGPGAEEEAETTPSEDQRAAGEDYAYEQGEDENTDERAGHSEESDEGTDGLSKEQKRRRRKRERYERDQRELAFLRQRNEQLEREQSRRFAEIETRQTQSDVLAIDGRIQQAQNDVREADNLFAQAVKSGDEGTIAEAMRVRDELRDGLRQMQGAKAQAIRNAQARTNATQQQQQGPDSGALRRANQWSSENPWFDPQLRDDDSAIAYAIEQRVFQEGRLDPSTDAYWDEVNRRLSRRLPDRFQGAEAGREDDDDEDEDERRESRRESPDKNGHGKRKPSGPTFRTGGRERALRKGEVYIDADRRAAMEEAGVWDDPVLREKFLKSYQKYDRDNGRRRH